MKTRRSHRSNKRQRKILNLFPNEPPIKCSSMEMIEGTIYDIRPPRGDSFTASNYKNPKHFIGLRDLRKKYINSHKSKKLLEPFIPFKIKSSTRLQASKSQTDFFTNNSKRATTYSQKSGFRMEKSTINTKIGFISESRMLKRQKIISRMLTNSKNAFIPNILRSSTPTNTKKLEANHSPQHNLTTPLTTKDISFIEGGRSEKKSCMIPKNDDYPCHLDLGSESRNVKMVKKDTYIDLNIEEVVKYMQKSEMKVLDPEIFIKFEEILSNEKTSKKINSDSSKNIYADIESLSKLTYWNKQSKMLVTRGKYFRFHQWYRKIKDNLRQQFNNAGEDAEHFRTVINQLYYLFAFSYDYVKRESEVTCKEKGSFIQDLNNSFVEVTKQSHLHVIKYFEVQKSSFEEKIRKNETLFDQQIDYLKDDCSLLIKQCEELKLELGQSNLKCNKLFRKLQNLSLANKYQKQDLETIGEMNSILKRENEQITRIIKESSELLELNKEESTVMARKIKEMKRIQNQYGEMKSLVTGEDVNARNKIRKSVHMDQIKEEIDQLNFLEKSTQTKNKKTSSDQETSSQDQNSETEGEIVFAKDLESGGEGEDGDDRRVKSPRKKIKTRNRCIQIGRKGHNASSQTGAFEKIFQEEIQMMKCTIISEHFAEEEKEQQKLQSQYKNQEQKLIKKIPSREVNNHSTIEIKPKNENYELIVKDEVENVIQVNQNSSKIENKISKIEEKKKSFSNSKKNELTSIDHYMLEEMKNMNREFDPLSSVNIDEETLIDIRKFQTGFIENRNSNIHHNDGSINNISILNDKKIDLDDLKSDNVIEKLNKKTKKKSRKNLNSKNKINESFSRKQRTSLGLDLEENLSNFNIIQSKIGNNENNRGSIRNIGKKDTDRTENNINNLTNTIDGQYNKITHLIKSYQASKNLNFSLNSKVKSLERTIDVLKKQIQSSMSTNNNVSSLSIIL